MTLSRSAAPSRYPPVAAEDKMLVLTSEEAAGCEIACNRVNSWVSQESKLETGLGGRTWEWRNRYLRIPVVFIVRFTTCCISVASIALGRECAPCHPPILAMIPSAPFVRR
jgi:hypothetical protein